MCQVCLSQRTLSVIGKSVHRKAIVLDKYLYMFIQECPGGREPLKLLTDLEKTGSRSCLWRRSIENHVQNFFVTKYYIVVSCQIQANEIMS